MKKITFLFCLCVASLAVFAQKKAGVNTDPYTGAPGQIPYEMKPEARQPQADFNDCTQWFVQTENCEASLYRSKQERVSDDYAAKIVYRTSAAKASIFVGLEKPLPLPKQWDCLDIWTRGDHWMWGEPEGWRSMPVYACFQGKDGQLHEERLVQAGYVNFAHKYWFMNHTKLMEGQQKYTHFLGYRLKGGSTDVGNEHTVYLGSTFIYQEVLKPLTFKPFPKELPFPLRSQTILPTNKVKEFENRLEKDGDAYVFTYQGADANLSYRLQASQLLGDIRVDLKGEEKQTITHRTLQWANGEEAQLAVKKVKLLGDTLFFEATGKYLKKRVPFKGWYTIQQKSLVFHLEEVKPVGCVKSLAAGRVVADGDAILTEIPFMKYKNSDRPVVLYRNGLFTMMMFDWYTTNASLVTMGPREKGVFTGGLMQYIPKTNGQLNPLNETLFINVSPDVQEVFPTIDNPASPMRSVQADRAWAINGGADLERLGEFVTSLRSRGLEKVTIRYHEDFWRAGGESYTFKLTPNPELGVKRIQDYVKFVKSNDWRVGLYSNYTDMATVNASWDPDHMKRGPKGEWEVSWARCYAPKPQYGWEQQALLAPQIQQLFGTNHSYCDVHTAVAPHTRVDFDHRVPDAGLMRGVFNRYGMILMNERRAYNGPVYSEGGHHWWYAGLLDGNYANDNLTSLPVFPDFSLLKIHPLEMDAANTGTGYQYLCYAMAYGNQAILSEGIDAVTRYAFLQPMQEDYVMIPVQDIAYYQDGVAYNSSDAIRKGLVKAPCLKVTYQSGLVTYVNFSKQPWEIEVDGQRHTLPTLGFFTYVPGKGKQSSSVWKGGHRLDEVYSSDLYYLNTHGQAVDSALGGNGHYLLKKEKFSWELIPLQEGSVMEFDLSLLKSGIEKAKIVGVNRDGNFVKVALPDAQGRVKLQTEEEVYKYQIIPTL